MDIPFTARLTKGFGKGQSLIIRGKPHHADALFAITFLDKMDLLENQHDIPTATAVFHISCRLSQQEVVMNSFQGNWGMEQRNPSFPLKSESNNEIKIVCSNDSYEIFFNGTHFESFMHRFNKDVTHFNFYGAFKIDEIIYN